MGCFVLNLKSIQFVFMPLSGTSVSSSPLSNWQKRRAQGKRVTVAFFSHFQAPLETRWISTMRGDEGCPLAQGASSEPRLSFFPLPTPAIPVACYVQDVQLNGASKLRGQPFQAVVSKGEDIQAATAPNLCREHHQAVPVHVEVGQLGEFPQRPREGLREEHPGVEA